VGGNPVSYVDPLGLAVIITIDNRTSNGVSVGGTFTVTSTTTGATLSGYTMENANPGNPLGPIPAGTYNAFIRTDHSPNRIELQNVPGYSNIQIHNGNNVGNYNGCFGVGASYNSNINFLGSTVNTLNQIINIINQDSEANAGIADITVIVGSVN
jgi:hypothetical protein